MAGITAVRSVPQAIRERREWIGEGWGSLREASRGAIGRVPRAGDSSGAVDPGTSGDL